MSSARGYHCLFIWPLFWRIEQMKLTFYCSFGQHIPYDLLLPFNINWLFIYGVRSDMKFGSYIYTVSGWEMTFDISWARYWSSNLHFFYMRYIFKLTSLILVDLEYNFVICILSYDYEICAICTLELSYQMTYILNLY